MSHFTSLNFSNLPFNNLKLPKSGEVDVSHQFKNKGQKEKYTIIWYLTFQSGNIKNRKSRETNWDGGSILYA